MSELSLDLIPWNQLHLTGLQFQHLNDPVISLSQTIWKQYIQFTTKEEVLFWEYIESIMFKPFFLNPCLGTTEEVTFYPGFKNDE